MYQKFIALALLLYLTLPTSAQELNLESKSVVLLEQSTGTLLYEQEAHTTLPPASVTKIMTILLVMDALEQGSVTKQEIVVVSANAAAMGGSQVYLKEGETMELWELLKCVAVVSGNDASVALAEHLYGSEEAFVEKMNQKAQSLSMTNTLFQNCTGLPADNHYTTAYDIALMSQALMNNHPSIQELTTIWMDTIRNGTFGLSNTNRLIHSYSGATGLKTGSTDEALYCLSATASRDNLDLIAVILQGPSSAQRFADATTLLDYGFAHYSLEEIYPSSPLLPIPVILGKQDYLQPQLNSPTKLLLSKGTEDQITRELTLLPSLQAPVQIGDEIGTFNIFVDGILQASTPLYASESIPRLTVLEIYTKLFQLLVMA